MLLFGGQLLFMGSLELKKGRICENSCVAYVVNG
jgi:hypothetical protein